MELYDLQVEHLPQPLGINAKEPRFGWKIKSDMTNCRQTVYRITAETDGRVIWDTGVVKSEDSFGIRYAGEPLKSRQRVAWHLEVRAGEETAQAEDFFEMGLLLKEDWKGMWIEPEDEIIPEKPQPAPYLRKTFTVDRGLKTARIYQTAHGLYRFWINGMTGTDDCFLPGNTSYYHRLQYQTYDITDALKEGKNVWAVCLGDGWWRGACGAFSLRNNYGEKVQFLGQIELEYEDGSREILPTDTSFVTETGGLIRNDMKLGSVYDARLEKSGWMNPDYDDSDWKPVHPAQEIVQPEKLVGTAVRPVREQERFSAKAFRDTEGNLVLDFGQNIAGYVKMTLRNLKPGQKIVLEHGEALRNGAFDNSNIFIKENSPDDMFQTVIYHAAGEREETFCPYFSIFGFRYVRLSGYEEKNLREEDFIAVAVYSDLEQTLKFECSNSHINRLVENTKWSQKSNFMDVPTDCPQRERAPWTGDAQVYCKTAAELMDVYAFFEKWMQDVAAEQEESGMVPSIAPGIGSHRFSDDKGKEMDGSAGWGDAAVIIPWRLFLSYGDPAILANQYESAKRWVDYMIAEAEKKNSFYEKEEFYRNGTGDFKYIWDSGFHWGEWSEPNFVMRTLPQDFVGERKKTGNPVVATGYLRYSTRLFSRMAQILGEAEDAKKYGAYSEKVAEVYDRYLVMENGEIRFSDPGRQAAYVRALAFDLCKKEKRPQVLKVLMELVEKEDYHLNTGFLSTALLLNVLTEEGHEDAAYRILEQTTPPSWLYPVVNGATTIYESWDGTDRFFGSFNHYSFGAVCDYLFSYTAGIRIDEKAPGYRHFYLKPVPGGSLTYAKAEFESPYGKIGSAWKKEDAKNIYRFEVPANTTATAELVDGTKLELGSGTYTVKGEVITNEV